MNAIYPQFYYNKNNTMWWTSGVTHIPARHENSLHASGQHFWLPSQSESNEHVDACVSGHSDLTWGIGHNPARRKKNVWSNIITKKLVPTSRIQDTRQFLFSWVRPYRQAKEKEIGRSKDTIYFTIENKKRNKYTSNLPSTKTILK